MTVYKTASSEFGVGRGAVFLSTLRCVGFEQDLLQCPHTVFVGRYCTHSRDVGLRCERKWFELSLRHICSSLLCGLTNISPPNTFTPIGKWVLTRIKSLPEAHSS